ncbi:MAG TPA: RagB/SusD family nutrient uptake outer membrane protein [Flavitalea sp.]|nr:RagB/SusD family nutrient uptake outer membrane protein [Flavitalea sp.]
MKTSFNYFLHILSLVILMTSCKKDFFEKKPLGVTTEDQLTSKAGAEGLLIGAYSILDGSGATAGSGLGLQWDAPGSNWLQGDVSSDDARKGSIPSDAPEMNQFELHTVLPTNGFVNAKWFTLYDGVSRCNDVLKVLQKAKDISEADANRIGGEARFLRAHYHFEAKKIWNNVPFIDETLTDTRVPNTDDIWPKIESDLQYAIDNLPETQDAVGRANKRTAQVYLAKAYLFEHKYAEAKPLLEEVISSAQYELNTNYGDNFDIATKNSKESVFAVQQSVNDGSTGSANGNYGDVLNYPFFGPFCCGFFQPTQNLVNAFKTDDNGLPLLDNFADEDVKNDEGIPFDAPFIPYDGNLDPRLDFTLGRRGIPYQEFGLFEGNWIRMPSYGGPYAPRKNVYRKSQTGTYTANTGTNWINANNYEFVRYSDILLMRAEVAVEEGDLGTALDLVNQVRNRAKNGSVITFDDGTPAANYKVEPYPAFPDQEYARRAVHFERRLELAMEGHRFYDLVRWGIADSVKNKFFELEGKLRTYLNGAQFINGKSEYLPIPQEQITNSYKDGQPTLVQNPGY